jgi:hypothetical protein
VTAFFDGVIARGIGDGGCSSGGGGVGGQVETTSCRSKVVPIQDFPAVDAAIDPTRRPPPRPEPLMVAPYQTAPVPALIVAKLPRPNRVGSAEPSE